MATDPTLALMYLEGQLIKTNHILHLILSVITGGFWIIIWALVAISNESQNAPIKRNINQIKLQMAYEATH